MPDGDIFHKSLKRVYDKPYKMLCEQKCSLKELERAILKAIRKRIKYANTEAIHQIEMIANEVSQSLNAEALSKDDRCILANKALDEVRYSSSLAPYWADLIVNAAKSYIHDIRYGTLHRIYHESEFVMERFYEEIYKSEFCVPILNLNEHHNDASPQSIRKQLSTLSPGIRKQLSFWAQKVVQDKSLSKMHLPRTKRNPVSLDENLLE